MTPPEIIVRAITWAREKHYRYRLRSRARQFGLIKAATQPQSASPLALFTVMRNERHQLDTFLAHYRKLGVTRFHIIDNGSTDGSIARLRQEDDVALYHSALSLIPLKEALNEFIRLHALGQWCVVVDADERLVYPAWETRSLRDLADFLDGRGETALHCHWLDMYARTPVAKAEVKPVPDILEQFPFFDPDELKQSASERVFNWRRYSVKFALIKVAKDTVIANGTHQVTPSVPSQMRGLVMHFAFHAHLYERAVEAVEKKQYARQSQKYQVYLDCLRDRKLTLHHPRSTRYENSRQLVHLGLLTSQAEWDRYHPASEAH